MPSFCRHNRFVERCPICSKELEASLPAAAPKRPRLAPAPSRPAAGSRRRAAPRASDLVTRRVARGADDGFHSPLVPGIRSSEDAARLADDLAFAAGRLAVLAADPPGLYAEAAAEPEAEEGAWLAAQIAFLAPLEAEDPWEGIRAARTTWASGRVPALEDVPLGPRAVQGEATLRAYREWAARGGSQLAALTGEASWDPARRFERVFERLALPGLHRAPRFELLVLLGRLGIVPLAAGRLFLVGDDPVTVAAKRALGIGDPLLLERRAAELAEGAGVPLEALDLAFHNWGGEAPRASAGVPGDAADADVRARASAVLGLGT